MPTTLRILEGPGKGSEFSLTPGDTIIGRGAKAQVKLAAADVSWEHLLITRAGEDWMIENLSAHGTLVNDQKISGRTRLRARDRIRIGDETLLRFETTDAGQNAALSSPWVLRGAGIVVVILILVWIASILFQKPAPVAHYPEAYALLLKWTQAEADAGRMPVNLPALFADARRLELAAIAQPEPTDKTAALFKNAAAKYQNLLLLLDGIEDRYQCITNAANHPNALTNLMQVATNPDAEVDTEEKSAALAQFVKINLAYCNNHAGKQ